MEDNYMATTRNGHELKDMYNPETNTLDIRSNGLYPSNVLSNMCSNGFRFDGMVCGSMEGFLQCSEDERHLLADRPDSMVEGTGNRPPKRRVSATHTPCLSSNVRAKRTIPCRTDADSWHHTRSHKR